MYLFFFVGVCRILRVCVCVCFFFHSAVRWRIHGPDSSRCVSRTRDVYVNVWQGRRGRRRRLPDRVGPGDLEEVLRRLPSTEVDGNAAATAASRASPSCTTRTRYGSRTGSPTTASSLRRGGPREDHRHRHAGDGCTESAHQCVPLVRAGRRAPEWRRPAASLGRLPRDVHRTTLGPGLGRSSSSSNPWRRPRVAPCGCARPQCRARRSLRG